MSEPTIDEMLDWYDAHNRSDYYDGFIPDPMIAAIRAILEHQRLYESPVEKIQLAAVRAFVERVEKRHREDYKGVAVVVNYQGEGDYTRFRNSLDAELASMEAEVKE